MPEKCEICESTEDIKIARRYTHDRFGMITNIDRQLCKDCIKFTDGYLKAIQCTELERHEY